MKRLLVPSRIAAALLLLAAITAAVLWIFPSDQYLLLPDPAHPVAPHVFVPHPRPDRNGGGIFFVDVVLRKAKLFESIFPGIHSGASLVPAKDLNPPCAGEKARREADLRDMSRSQSIAALVALRALGYHVIARPTGVLVTGVDPTRPAACLLQPTDLIVAVDGISVRAPAGLRRIMRRHGPGDRVRFTVHRGKEARVVVVRTIADPQDPTRAIVGIQIDQAADIKLPVKVRIETGEVGGPSAGLPFALEVMEKFGRDVDHGYKIAATGEIGLDGSVRPIGGVRQKTVGARQSHVDVFLVPAGDNADEARRHAGGLRVIPVKSFPQALQALATLPPKM